METLTARELSMIRESIKEKYARVAAAASGCFEYPTGEEALRLQKYPQEIIQKFPRSLLQSYCGVGNPFSLGHIYPGEAILDIGCGAGVDAFVAAFLTGPQGRVVGVDMTPAMIDQANENLELIHLHHVSFETADAESLPFPNNEFHVVISNGVLNLTTNKEKALSEAYRVLKPCGRFMIADMVLVKPLSPERERHIENWYQ